MNCPKFGFIFSTYTQFSDIYDFEDAVWHASGYGYGETAREAIINACKYTYQDCTLWDVPRNPSGYLVEFDGDGNIVNTEHQMLCIACETTYTIKFADGNNKTFFKASN